MSEDNKKKISKTVNLPKTKFSMKANLTQREPQMLAAWNKDGLYGKIRELRKGAEPFILHDGPPYANGNIHAGTTLNKVLKDIIVKYKSMRGYDTPYVPGWDCHGLPIEHKVVSEMGSEAKNKSKLQIRWAACPTRH